MGQNQVVVPATLMHCSHARLGPSSQHTKHTLQGFTMVRVRLFAFYISIQSGQTQQSAQVMRMRKYIILSKQYESHLFYILVLG